MLFSTYKLLAYVGLVICPLFLFFFFDGIFQDTGAALALTLLFVVLIVPLQFYQLQRLQTALDFNNGSIPMGAFAWYDLEDDADDGLVDDRPDPRAGLPTCPSCGQVQLTVDTQFCGYCGARLRPEAPFDGLPSAPAD